MTPADPLARLVELILERQWRGSPPVAVWLAIVDMARSIAAAQAARPVEGADLDQLALDILNEVRAVLLSSMPVSQRHAKAQNVIRAALEAAPTPTDAPVDGVADHCCHQPNDCKWGGTGSCGEPYQRCLRGHLATTTDADVEAVKAALIAAHKTSEATNMNDYWHAAALAALRARRRA